MDLAQGRDGWKKAGTAPLQRRHRTATTAGLRPFRGAAPLLHDPLAGGHRGGLRRPARAGRWALVRPPSRCPRSIPVIVRPLGLIQRRTASLLNLVRHVEEEHDGDLIALGALPDPELLAQLSTLPGLGPKGVRCVALYSFQRDVLPVDVHVLRLSKRLGFLDREATWQQAHTNSSSSRSPPRTASTPTCSSCCTGDPHAGTGTPPAPSARTHGCVPRLTSRVIAGQTTSSSCAAELAG